MISRFSPLPRALVLLGLTATGACSKLEPGRFDTTASTTTSGAYQTLSSTAAVTSTLGGSALKTNTTANSTSLASVSGALKHDTGATNTNDGTYQLNDPDGIDSAGIVTDGVSVMLTSASQGFSSSYAYVRPYTQTYVAQGSNYSATGVIGIVTSAADMPSSGAATYTGEANGTYTNASGSYNLRGGTSSVTADFAAKNVTVRMSGLSATNQASGASANVGFDAVEIGGMALSGNTFSGGSMTTRKGSATVAAVGTRTGQLTQGRFYGQSADGTPDEAAGVARLSGTGGTVTTVFIAD